mmetsp:Transcript_71385/g.144495  ORF Transcript_71385/g.144495 Transcript_71385/m.144495 type:complete len:394 (+) Transcript_71385:207-1388(+)
MSGRAAWKKSEEMTQCQPQKRFWQLVQQAGTQKFHTLPGVLQVRAMLHRDGSLVHELQNTAPYLLGNPFIHTDQGCRDLLLGQLRQGHLFQNLKEHGALRHHHHPMCQKATRGHPLSFWAHIECHVGIGDQTTGILLEHRGHPKVLRKGTRCLVSLRGHGRPQHLEQAPQWGARVAQQGLRWDLKVLQHERQDPKIQRVDGNIQKGEAQSVLFLKHGRRRLCGHTLEERCRLRIEGSAKAQQVQQGITFAVVHLIHLNASSAARREALPEVLRQTVVVETDGMPKDRMSRGIPRGSIAGFPRYKGFHDGFISRVHSAPKFLGVQMFVLLLLHWIGGLHSCWNILSSKRERLRLAYMGVRQLDLQVAQHLHANLIVLQLRFEALQLLQFLSLVQ